MYWVRLTLKLKSKSKFRGEILVSRTAEGRVAALGRRQKQTVRGPAGAARTCPFSVSTDLRG